MGEPELVRSKEKVSLNGYLKEMLTSTQEQLAEEKMCNMELEAHYLVTQIQSGRKRITDLNKEEVTKVLWYMLEKGDVVDRRRQILTKEGNGGSVTSSGTSGEAPVEKPAGDGNH